MIVDVSISLKSPSPWTRLLRSVWSFSTIAQESKVGLELVASAYEVFWTRVLFLVIGQCLC